MRLIIGVKVLLINYVGMAQSNVEYPRGILTREEINQDRQRPDKEPYKIWWKYLDE